MIKQQNFKNFKIWMESGKNQNKWNNRKSWITGGKQLIKYAEIYKQNIQGEIRYIAKIYVTYRDEMIDSFSSSCLEKVVEYLISKEYVITNYFDMTETEK